MLQWLMGAVEGCGCRMTLDEPVVQAADGEHHLSLQLVVGGLGQTLRRPGACWVSQAAGTRLGWAEAYSRVVAVAVEEQLVNAIQPKDDMVRLHWEDVVLDIVHLR